MDEYFLEVEKELVAFLRQDERYSSKKAKLIDWGGDAIQEYDDYTFRVEYIRKKFRMRSSGLYFMLTHNEFPSEMVDLWRKKNYLNVSSYGSGPGSDLIGFHQFCTKQNINTNLQALDTELGWESSIRQLNALCNTHINFVHIQDDLVSNLKFFYRCDVLILSWVIHLVKTEGILQLLLNALPETTIIVRDRFGSSLYSLFPNCKQTFIEDSFENKKNQQIVLYNIDM